MAKEHKAPTPDAPVEAKAAKVTTLDVYAATGGLIRTYSLADHGADFQKLANEFVAHTPGATIAAH